MLVVTLRLWPSSVVTVLLGWHLLFVWIRCVSVHSILQNLLFKSGRVVA